MCVSLCQVYLSEGEALQERVTAALSDSPGVTMEEKESLVLSLLLSPVVVEGAERLASATSTFWGWSAEVQKVMKGKWATL